MERLLAPARRPHEVLAGSELLRDVERRANIAEEARKDAPPPTACAYLRAHIARYRPSARHTRARPRPTLRAALRIPTRRRRAAAGDGRPGARARGPDGSGCWRSLLRERRERACRRRPPRGRRGRSAVSHALPPGPGPGHDARPRRRPRRRRRRSPRRGWRSLLQRRSRSARACPRRRLPPRLSPGPHPLGGTLPSVRGLRPGRHRRASARSRPPFLRRRRHGRR